LITSKKILGALLGTMLMSVVLVATAPAMGENAKPSTPYVCLDGWCFAITDPGWRVYDDVMCIKEDSNDCSDILSCPQGHWKGLNVIIPFYFPAFPKAPKGNEYYDSISARVGSIRVLEIPEDLRKDIEDYDIAVYGSPDKVPAKVKEKETEQILADSIANFANSIYLDMTKYDKEISTTIKGHKAYLKTGEDDEGSIATAAVLLDDDTIGVIHVMVEKTPGKDRAVYKGKAKDVINAFTFEKEIV